MNLQLYARTAILVMAAVSLGARELKKVSSGGIVVVVADADGESGPPRVTLQHSGNPEAVTIQLTNHTEVVNDIRFLDSRRVLVRGKLSRQGIDDVLTVVDAVSAKIVDTIWAREAAFSPDGRLVAYKFRTPDTVPEELQTALVVYDLTAPPPLNTIQPGNYANPSERGIVIYPDDNRAAQRYWLVLDQSEKLSSGRPVRSFVSPIGWSQDSRRLAVVEQQLGKEHIVAIDISRGLRQPVVVLEPIAREVFLEPRFLTSLPQEYADSYPAFRELRFDQDGQSITFWGLGPFVEKSVAVSVPELWDVLKEAIRARGPDQAAALAMLGMIGDAESRALIEATLKGKDGAAISFVAAGLTPIQCALYLNDLGRAAQESEQGGSGIKVLDAIARAGTTGAAQILQNIADSERLPESGVAFGLLEKMGRDAQPSLVRLVTSGRSPLCRETAVWTLIRMNSVDAVAAFRSVLHDPDEKVQIAAAQGLAYLGDAEGKSKLEIAAANAASGSAGQIQSLVGLAVLGQTNALEKLRALAESPDEAIRGRVVWGVVWSGNMGIKDFVYRLGLDRVPVFRSMMAERLLDPRDPRDMAVLREMITAGDDMAKLAAAQRLLGTKLTTEAERTVANGIGSTSGPVRDLAVQIASAYEPLRPELAKALSSQDPTVQIAALAAIAGLHDKGRIHEVAPYLSSESSVVSAAAARTLHALDPDVARPILERGLTSTNSHVRIHSAAMLLAAGARAQRR